jgi:hypothetical protein
MDAVDRDHTGYIIDSDSIVCFGDAHLATAVGANGDVVYLVYDLEHECPERGCCQVVTPAHEKTGRLGREVRARVWPCLAATRNGHPCGNSAPIGEDRCGSHRGWPARGGG